MHHLPSSSQHPVDVPSGRQVKPLPIQLLDHSTVCFEEQLFSQGLSLESQCLESGIETNHPARLPPPSHLAFASTLTVQPYLTTRTIDKDRHIGSNDALKYLRHVINTVDAKDAGLKDAFRFENGRAQSDRSKRARTRKSDTAGASDEEPEKPGFIRSNYYRKSSLWTHAEDFWAILGWALNCSIRHKGRWERWKAWLEQMLDMLQNDLEKSIASRESHEVDIAETMLAHYLSTIAEGRNNRRRLLRAIFADGSSKSVGEFGEIWRNETRPPKKQKEDRPNKRRKLDLDNGEYGDYFDAESDDESEERKRRSRSATVQTSKSRRGNQDVEADFIEEEEDADEDETLEDSTMPGGIDAFGGMDSIRLRQRLLALLTRFTRVAPSFFVDTEDLFSLFTEFLRPLPLPVFQQFVLPLKPYLSSDLQASFNEMLFRPLLGESSSTELITQEAFEINFAPQAAINTTAADNAKVSLLTESLLRALWRSRLLMGDIESLRVSVEEGIKAREEKVGFDGRKKSGKKAELDEEAKATLQCSAERMRVLLDVIAS